MANGCCLRYAPRDDPSTGVFRARLVQRVALPPAAAARGLAYAFSGSAPEPTPGSHRSLREPVARPQPVASVHPLIGPPPVDAAAAFPRDFKQLAISGRRSAQTRTDRPA